MTAPAGRLLDGFLDALASERGASANTLEAYRRDLSDYQTQLSAQGTDALKAGAAHVQAYLSSRGAGGLSAASLARRLSAIRQFHKHLYAEGLRRDDPTLSIEGPRRARPLPKVLTVEDVDRLIRTAREGLDAPERPLRERLAAARMACLIELIYGSGLTNIRSARAAEVRGAREGAACRRARQGRQGAAGAAVESLSRRNRRLPRAPERGRARHGGLAVAFSGRQRERTHDAAGLCPRSETRRLGGRSFACAREPARAAPRLREPPPAERRRSQGRAGPARPRRHFDHADLYPRARRTRQGDGAGPASDERRRQDET